MQVPVSPKEDDSSLSGQYVLLCVEHVLRTCRGGLWWDDSRKRPLVMVPRDGPHLHAIGVVRTPPIAEALVHRWEAFFVDPRWFQAGDAHALRGVLRLTLLYKWIDAKVPLPLGERELREAVSDLPRELRASARSVAYAPSRLNCTGPHPWMQGAVVGD